MFESSAFANQATFETVYLGLKMGPVSRFQSVQSCQPMGFSMGQEDADGLAGNRDQVQQFIITILNKSKPYFSKGPVRVNN